MSLKFDCCLNDYDHSIASSIIPSADSSQDIVGPLTWDCKTDIRMNDPKQADEKFSDPSRTDKGHACSEPDICFAIEAGKP